MTSSVIVFKIKFFLNLRVFFRDRLHWFHGRDFHGILRSFELEIAWRVCFVNVEFGAVVTTPDLCSDLAGDGEIELASLLWILVIHFGK